MMLTLCELFSMLACSRYYVNEIDSNIYHKIVRESDVKRHDIKVIVMILHFT